MRADITLDDEVRVVTTSVALYDCLCEFEDNTDGAGACHREREAWDTAVIAYKQARDNDASLEGG